MFRKPVSLGTTSAWAVETGSRTETTVPTLDDAYADIDEWLGGEAEASFSTQQSAAFVIGDGSNKPKSFLSYDIIAESSHARDKIGFTLSGAAAAFAASNPADKLIDLV